MTTFARIDGGLVCDPQPNDSEADYRARNPFFASWPDVREVQDGTAQGAGPDGQGGWSNPVAPIVRPQPNNANNPYFGKKLLSGGQFMGLVMGALGMAAWIRLINDTAFSGIKAFLQAEGTIVNTDDKQGQFLKIVGYLTTTNAVDGKPLMTPQDVATVMAGWQGVQNG